MGDHEYETDRKAESEKFCLSFFVNPCLASGDETFKNNCSARSQRAVSNPPTKTNAQMKLTSSTPLLAIFLVVSCVMISTAQGMIGLSTDEETRKRTIFDYHLQQDTRCFNNPLASPVAWDNLVEYQQAFKLCLFLIPGSLQDWDIDVANETVRFPFKQWVLTPVVKSSGRRPHRRRRGATPSVPDEYHLNETFALTMTEEHRRVYGNTPAFFLSVNGIFSPIRKFRDLNSRRVFPRDTVFIRVEKGLVTYMSHEQSLCSRCPQPVPGTTKNAAQEAQYGCSDNTNLYLQQGVRKDFAERTKTFTKSCFVHEDACSRLGQGACDFRLKFVWVGSDRRGTELSEEQRGEEIELDSGGRSAEEDL